MDWMNRGARQNQPINQTVSHTGVGGSPPTHHRRAKDQGLVKATTVALLFSVALLVIAVVLYTVFGSRPSNEGKFVDTTKYQAVFLNGGQVYFGHIRTLNSRYMRVDSIYYLRVNQTVQPNQSTTTQNNDVSLVKLGCELHGPQDQMVINREQIIFWENLKDDGQVGKAIAEFIKTNPNGQKCDTTPAPAATTPAPATTTTPSTKR